MNNTQNHEFGMSHQYWLDEITKNSIRKNTMRKPPFDATKDVTEKDQARNRYMRMLDASIYTEQNRILKLERIQRFERIRDRVILAIGSIIWITGLILSIKAIINTF